MGLLTPVELPLPNELGAVHFIAIGGSGMNGIASMMLAQGIRVSGSDRQDSKYLRFLETQGARVHVGHRAEQLGDASTVVASSASTGFASPCNAATLAAAAASITSFLRRPPRDNSRTRAVAVDATSSTRSPRATSHCARWRPKPRAFSTAQRRSLNPSAHRFSRR